MTITYSLTSRDALRGFFQLLGASAAFRFRLFLMTSIFMLLMLVQCMAKQHMVFQLADLLFAVLSGATLLCLLPLLTALTVKRSPRTFSIDAQGIHSIIGDRSGAVAWNNIAALAQGDDFIFIIRTTGNACMIPKCAFVDAAQQSAFLSLIAQYC